MSSLRPVWQTQTRRTQLTLEEFGKWDSIYSHSRMMANTAKHEAVSPSLLRNFDWFDCIFATNCTQIESPWPSDETWPMQIWYKHPDGVCIHHQGMTPCPSSSGSVFMLCLFVSNYFDDVSASKVSVPYPLSVFMPLPRLNWVSTAPRMLRHARTATCSVRTPRCGALPPSLANLSV